MRSLSQMALDIVIASADPSHPPSLVDAFKEEYEKIEDHVMSNLDHIVDDEVAAKLKTGKFWAPLYR